MANPRTRAFCSLLALLVQGTNASLEDCQKKYSFNVDRTRERDQTYQEVYKMSLRQCLGTCNCWGSNKYDFILLRKPQSAEEKLSKTWSSFHMPGIHHDLGNFTLRQSSKPRAWACIDKCLSTDGNGGLRLKSVDYEYERNPDYNIDNMDAPVYHMFCHCSSKAPGEDDVTLVLKNHQNEWEVDGYGLWVRTCKEDCEDIIDQSHCALLASRGDCYRAWYMDTYCKFSCGKCFYVCEDKDDDCISKTKLPGQCDDEELAKRCPKSCKTCAEVGHWSPWVNEGSCSRTCGYGLVDQTRSCYRRAFPHREQIDDKHCKPGMNRTKGKCSWFECKEVFGANAAGQMAPSVLLAVLMCFVALVA